MNKKITLACKVALRETKGGLGGFCEDYGHNYQTVATKLNPNDFKSWLNLVELEEIIEYTNDPRILESICDLFGAKYTINTVSNLTYEQIVLAAISETNESQTELIKALTNNNLTVKQEEKLIKELTEGRDSLDLLINQHKQNLESKRVRVA